jgi:hypothetical protein
MSIQKHWHYWFAFNLLYRQTVVADRSRGLGIQESVPGTF